LTSEKYLALADPKLKRGGDSVQDTCGEARSAGTPSNLREPASRWREKERCFEFDGQSIKLPIGTPAGSAELWPN